MICPKCQGIVEDGAKFCSNCGSPLPEKRPDPPTPQPEALKTCKVCGVAIPESAICCPECGKFAGGITKDTPRNNTNAAKPAPTVNVKYCKACGKSIPKSAFYCPICNKIADTPPAPATVESNGMALAGFILSFFVPILGLIFGIIGLKRANNGADRRGLAIAAIVISVLSWVISFISIFSMMNDLLAMLTYY